MVVSFINHLYALVMDLLEWAQCHLLSLRATHVWGILNIGADMLSRSTLPSEEWRLYPQTVQVIWDIFGKADVELFASQTLPSCCQQHHG